MNIPFYSKIIYIVADFFYIFVINILYKSWFGTIPRAMCKLPAFLLFILADCFIYFSQTKPLFFVLSAFTFFLLLSFIYSNRLKDNLIGATIALVLSMLSELVSLGLVSLVQLTISAKNTGFITISLIILCKIIFFIEILLCNRLFKNNNVYPLMPKKNIGIFVIPSISVWLLLYTSLFSGYSTEYENIDSDLPTLITAILILVMNIVVYYMFDKQAETYSIKLENNILSNSISSQTKQYQKELAHNESIRQIRHDMVNYLISIESQIDNNEYDEAVLSIKNKLNEISETAPISHTGYYILDSLMNYKAGIAAAKRIEFIYKSAVSTKPDISDGDLCILIGSAIDNAIEYLENSDFEEKKVRINIVSNATGFMFKISNHVQIAPKIMDGHYIASSKNELYHGYGLKVANSIAARYNGEIVLECIDNEYHFNAIIH